MNITTPDSYLHDTNHKKRRPGRPKGSGKKVKEQLLTPKRPVGRPRRDGLPSGSVLVRPKRDSSAPKDDWTELSQNEPDDFLSSLISALSSLPPPTSSGPSAAEAFKSHLNSLAPTSAHNQNLPTLYSILKTFWLPTSPGYFSLTASASARTLSDHKFFYWDPQPLVFNGIACPSCSAPLHNQGRIQSGPLKVFDVEREFFVIGAEYVCKTEKKSFASTDASILRALPSKLRDELPIKFVHANEDVGSDENAWCWKPAGVSKTLWNLVLGCVRADLKKETIVRLLRDTQKGLEPLQVVESDQLKAPSPDRDFMDAYSNAWTASSVTTVENDESQRLAPVETQNVNPISPSTSSLYASYTQSQSNNQNQPTSFNSGSYRFTPYDYPSRGTGPNPIPTPTPTLSESSVDSVLHSAVSAAQVQPQPSPSSFGAISESLGLNDHTRLSPSHHAHTPSTTSSQLSPSVTPVLTHSTIPSSSSATQPSSTATPLSRVQQRSSSNVMNTVERRNYAYPVTDYTVQEQPRHSQKHQQIQHTHSQPLPVPQIQIQHSEPQSQSLPQIQIHPFQQNHPGLVMNSPGSAAAHEIIASSLGMVSHHIHRYDTNGSGHLNVNENLHSTPSPTDMTLQQQLTGTAPVVSSSTTQSIAAAPPLPTISAANTSAPTPTVLTQTQQTTSFINGQRPQRQRNPRHCSKCGMTQCKGKGGRTFCTNACRDCGRLDCKGRNSRRPDKTCQEGWV
ncbi:hypothetical protein BDP27DRAFT_1319527 [Rhodocollybia butyracea]|uniref:DUF6729 domain-containing protein n=1 Tax=Rhodocollybia butyracea TaxID=206335 RepID=A0A9P5UC65_9AGAR|nr:hypothetical protein BDP27DRAFT_1319527 [Rhodocollybia butyracea]